MPNEAIITIIVTGGAVRDIAGLEQVGVPVFARGLTANSPQKNGPGSVGLEVCIGGAVVRSGDLATLRLVEDAYRQAAR
jgi:4-hydroxy-4-methyl-2-oxoglutarate aldolase